MGQLKQKHQSCSIECHVASTHWIVSVNEHKIVGHKMLDPSSLQWFKDVMEEILQ